MKRAILWLVITAAVFAGALGVQRHFERMEAGHPATPTATAPLAIGQRAPDLRLPDPAGKVHALSEFAGRPLLINLWAYWCSPCMQELPLLQQAQAEYGRERLTVLAIGADTESDVAGAVGQHRLDGLVVLMDTSSGANEVAPFASAQGGLPHTVLLDAERRVLASKSGSFRDIDELRDFIAAAIPRVKPAG